MPLSKLDKDYISTLENKRLTISDLKNYVEIWKRSHSSWCTVFSFDYKRMQDPDGMPEGMRKLKAFVEHILENEVNELTFWQEQELIKIIEESPVAQNSYTSQIFTSLKTSLKENHTPTELIDRLIEDHDVKNAIKECNCVPGLQRKTEGNYRDIFDKEILEFAKSHNLDKITILYLASGNLKQLLTASATLMANNISVDWIIIEPRIHCKIGMDEGLTDDIFPKFEAIAQDLGEKHQQQCRIIGKFFSVFSYIYAKDTAQIENAKNRNMQDEKSTLIKNLREKAKNFFEKHPQTNSIPKGNDHFVNLVNASIDAKENKNYEPIYTNMLVTVDFKDHEPCILAINEYLKSLYNQTPFLVSVQKRNESSNELIFAKTNESENGIPETRNWFSR